jgi:hypothetical protein
MESTGQPLHYVQEELVEDLTCEVKSTRRMVSYTINVTPAMFESSRHEENMEWIQKSWLRMDNYTFDDAEAVPFFKKMADENLLVLKHRITVMMEMAIQS